MELTQLGNNTITYCSHCDDLLTVKGSYDTEALKAVIDAHRKSHPECQAYYDALPTLSKSIAALRQIAIDTCAKHDCNPGPCPCICGCGIELACRNPDSWGGILCAHCALRVIREDDEHGEPENFTTPTVSPPPPATPSESVHPSRPARAPSE